ncbi:hypothetical protein ONZ43_g4553 [Nemania bipapillata]|uniref:Uncharacterized protein n=1 Tax=Nemania bipapillata TaxID=110536 RepID=A0ACC2ILD5_9PEZI|nr:hypothetical protein ONZ43_g4553 [Nemania bipapillata]
MSEPAIPYTRLHITPFDLSLQSVVIPASVLPHARNISYHTIETFPEKRFGFVDLPAMDAEKLKKKLNGAVLKGTKMRVETALPEPVPQPPADADTAKAKKEKKKSKKRKHEAGVIEGIQLDDRKVKRGWTTTEQEMIEEKRKRARKGKKDDNTSRDDSVDKKDKRDKKKKRVTIKSKYTDDPECLFKTKLPNTSLPKEPEGTGEDASPHRKKRRRKSDREVIVHEFEKTTKYPTFLKSKSTSASAETTTFQDGVGWVDSTGKVVEPVTTSRRRPEANRAPASPKPKKTAPIQQAADSDDETSSSGSSSSSDGDDATSSSDSESDVSDTRTETVATPQQLKVEVPALKSPPSVVRPESARPKSSSSVTSLSIKIPPTTPAKKVHPLEALYKRPQGDNSTPDGGSKEQPFSFFGNDDLEEDGDSMAPTSQAPMTPFTKQEFEFRNVRSAAPTPDTAHPSRSFHFWASQSSAEDAELGEGEDVQGLDDVEEQEQEDEDADMDDAAASGQTSQAPTSDFQKQFWESRGDLNRAWRKRRKTASKEKRYRDNRARADRAI